MDTETWGNFFKYGQRYCNGWRDRYGWKFDGASNMAELNDRLTGPAPHAQQPSLVDIEGGPAVDRRAAPLAGIERRREAECAHQLPDRR